MKVRVCVRTRPTQNFAQDNLSIDTEHGTIRVKHMEPETNPSAGPNNRQNAFSFKFDYVFHNATQAAVYDLYARDCVHGVSSGINGSILSYGQTGSGKTFTMIGDANSYEHRGVAPRAINQLFAEIGSRVETEYMVSCTFMEIYNERIYDLLGDLNTPDYANEYTIAEDTGKPLLSVSCAALCRRLRPCAHGLRSSALTLCPRPSLCYRPSLFLSASAAARLFGLGSVPLCALPPSPCSCTPLPCSPCSSDLCADRRCFP